MCINVCTAADRQKIDINTFVKQALKEKKEYVRIPAGEYETDETVFLKKINNLVLDGTGVKLIITQFKHAFYIEECDKLTIKGFTIDYVPIPFTQGTITSIGKNNTFEFEIHTGYPDLNQKTIFNCVYVFDRTTRLWKKGVGDVYCKMKITDARHGSFSTYLPQPLLEVNDLICIDPRKKSCMYICNGTKNFLLEDVTFLAAPGATILGRLCGENHRFRNITIKRGPRPRWATQDRLLSTNADGLNYAVCNSTPVVENCDFGFMGDDGINFHGPVFEIVKVESPTSFMYARIGKGKTKPYTGALQAGQVMRHLDKGDYNILGKTIFKSIEQVVDHGLGNELLMKSVPTYVKRQSKQFAVYRVTITDPLPMMVGQSFDIPALNCSGFVIRNSYFHDNRPRGVRLMASHGIIEDNRFERIRDAGITIGNEYPHWGEAGWVEDVIIRNNILKDIGTGNVFVPYNKIPGAICIFAMSEEGVKSYPQGHRNIQIKANTIQNCAPSAIYVYGARDVIIEKNIVSNTHMQGSARAGSDAGLGPQKPIDIHASARATVIDNTITSQISKDQDKAF